jgi:hypothetical protein
VVELELGVIEQVKSTRLSSGVRHTWKNRSQRFNHGKGSPTPLNLGNSILWDLASGTWPESPVSSSPLPRRVRGGGRLPLGVLYAVLTQWMASCSSC